MLPVNISSLMAAESGNDSYTKLLLHFNDMSLMNVAKGGTPSVVTPYNVLLDTGTKKFGPASMRWQGGGASYMIVKNSTDWDFGAGSFTVDWWEYRTAAADGAAVFRRQSDNVAQGFLLGHTASNRNQCYMSSDGTNWDVSAVDVGPVTLNVWNHFAVVRNGNTFYHFKNGVQTATWSSSLALLPCPASHTMCIGHWNGVGFQGYLDEMRISKGIARWTSNFNPPQRAYGPNPDYSAWHTVRLYHYDNITNAAGAQFPDSSLYATGLTGGNGYGHPYNAFAGGPQGSQYFDTANYYNVLTGTEDLNFGGGDFTIEWWDWRSDAADSRPGMVRWTATKTYQPFLIGWAGGGIMYAYASNDAANWNVVSGLSLGSMTANVWSHRAVVRKSGIFYGFKDGVLQSSYAGSSLPIYSVGNDAMFVGVWNAEGAQYWGYGLIDELRISKGIGRWTANFTPPTVPYLPDNTMLLMHFDSFVDASPYRRGAAAVSGGAAVSAAQSKFGGVSASFNGTNSGISYPDNNDWIITGDYTIDFWLRLNAYPGAASAFAIISRDVADFNIFHITDTFTVAFGQYIASTVYNTNGPAVVPLNQWVHIAFVRQSNNVQTMYLNGVGGTPVSVPQAITCKGPLQIGSRGANGWYLNGYLDELRLTKGKALWTANFTPPTEPYT